MAILKKKWLHLRALLLEPFNILSLKLTVKIVLEVGNLCQICGHIYWDILSILRP